MFFSTLVRIVYHVSHLSVFRIHVTYYECVQHVLVFINAYIFLLLLFGSLGQ